MNYFDGWKKGKLERINMKWEGGEDKQKIRKKETEKRRRSEGLRKEKGREREREISDKEDKLLRG